MKEIKCHQCSTDLSEYGSWCVITHEGVPYPYCYTCGVQVIKTVHKLQHTHKIVIPLYIRYQ